MNQFANSNAVVLVSFVLALVVVVKALAGSSGKGLPLAVRPHLLMTPMERRTLAWIESALPWARVHAQVSMGAILAPAKRLNRSQATTVRNRFSSKRVDFVVEDRATGHIVLLIELDDRTHDARADAARDRMTAAAGYSTLRLPAREKPDAASVRRHIEDLLARHPDLLPRSRRPVC
jgi:very-short-patch-repair endonuclease